MRPDEWAQVKALFEAALELPGADRERFLVSAACAPILRRHEVQPAARASRGSARSGAESVRQSLMRAGRLKARPYVRMRQI